MESPNPLRAAWSMVRARRVSPPRTFGVGRTDERGLFPVLEALSQGGTPALTGVQGEIALFLKQAQVVDPPGLTRSEALAYWLNLYNAGALDLAARAFSRGAGSVLRVPGAFTTPVFRVAGEHLSLDDIEHGKIRRFGDPRIHGALVCGSVSCPTLRLEPYRGDRLDDQLDDQMRRFLTGGGAQIDDATRSFLLSRVFLWYGGDFTRPHRMPTWLPARSGNLVTALGPWLDLSPGWIEAGPINVGFQPYDWGLLCSVG